MSIDWRIYYDDGFRLDGTWDTEIPLDRRVGVLIIAVKDKEHNWSFWHNKDFYIRTIEDDWLGVDTYGLIDHALHKPFKLALAGRTVQYDFQRDMLNKAVSQAMKDCKPEKTGWHVGELPE